MDEAKEKKGIKQLFKYLWFQVIVPNIVWITMLSIPSAVFGIRWIVQGVRESAINGEVPYTILIGAGACCLICLLVLISNIIFLVAYIRTPSKNQPIFPKLETDYKIISAEFELYFENREVVIQRQTVNFEVVSEFMNSIRHTTYWTGDSYGGSTLSDVSEKKGYEIEEKKVSSALFDLNVKFPETKKRGFSDEYSFSTKATDHKKKMMPVFGRVIKCQTDKVCIKVTAPIGLIKKCERFVSADIPGEIKLSPVEEVVPEVVGQYLCYKWDIPNPDLLRYYFLQWTFVDNV